jgi:hypothetical protein
MPPGMLVPAERIQALQPPPAVGSVALLLATFKAGRKMVPKPKRHGRRQPPSVTNSPVKKELMEANPCHVGSRHWPNVSRNDSVTVTRDGEIIYTGIVDDQTEDGTAIWILPKNDHRQLVHISDGVHLSKLEE